MGITTFTVMLTIDTIRVTDTTAISHAAAIMGTSMASMGISTETKCAGDTVTMATTDTDIDAPIEKLMKGPSSPEGPCFAMTIECD